MDAVTPAAGALPDHITLLGPRDEDERRLLGRDASLRAPWNRRSWIVTGGVAVVFVVYTALANRRLLLGVATFAVVMALGITTINRFAKQSSPIRAYGATISPGGIEIQLESCQLWFPTNEILSWAVVGRCFVVRFASFATYLDARPLAPGADATIAALLALPPAPRGGSEPPVAEWRSTPADERATVRAYGRTVPRIRAVRVLLLLVLFLAIAAMSLSGLLVDTAADGTTAADRIGLPAVLLIAAATSVAVTAVTSAVTYLFGRSTIGKRARGQILQVRLYERSLTVTSSFGDATLVPYDAIAVAERRRDALVLFTSDRVLVLIPLRAFLPGQFDRTVASIPELAPLADGAPVVRSGSA